MTRQAAVRARSTLLLAARFESLSLRQSSLIWQAFFHNCVFNPCMNPFGMPRFAIEKAAGALAARRAPRPGKRVSRPEFGSARREVLPV
jgi:hypothetical protein